MRKAERRKGLGGGGNLINVYKYMKRGYKDGARLLPVVLRDRTRGNGHTVKHMMLHLNIRKLLL